MTARPRRPDPLHSGKVRDLYRTADGQSADGRQRPDLARSTSSCRRAIPDKGRILTAMTVWWFEQLADLVPNHLISVDDPCIPAQWRGRAMLCQELDMVPVEAVARGYLDRLRPARLPGHRRGLRHRAAAPACVDGDRLPEPIFTPATQGGARRARRERLATTPSSRRSVPRRPTSCAI